MIGGTDCGFAQGPFGRRVHPTIMWAKLRALSEGAAIASRALSVGCRQPTVTGGEVNFARIAEWEGTSEPRLTNVSEGDRRGSQRFEIVLNLWRRTVPRSRRSIPLWTVPMESCQR